MELRRDLEPRAGTFASRQRELPGKASGRTCLVFGADLVFSNLNREPSDERADHVLRRALRRAGSRAVYVGFKNIMGPGAQPAASRSTDRWSGIAGEEADAGRDAAGLSVKPLAGLNASAASRPTAATLRRSGRGKRTHA